jgi:hypothetical protein
MPSTQEVDMEMKYRLPRSRTHIQHGPISLLDVPLTRNLGRRQVTAADHLGVVSLRLLQASKMLPGDDQHMRRRLGVDVLEGQHVLVLVNFLGRNLAAENAAEEAVAAGIGHRLVTVSVAPTGNHNT